MSLLLVVFSLFIAILATHIICWSLYYPKREVFFLMYLCGAYWFLGLAAGIHWLHWDFFQSTHFTFFHFSWSFVYLVTFLGIRDVGPSFLILRALERAGANGLSKERLWDVVTDEYLIDTRINAMKQGGILRPAQEHGLALTRKGFALYWFYVGYRCLLGKENHGG